MKNIGRRNFLQMSAAGIALAATARVKAEEENDSTESGEDVQSFSVNQRKSDGKGFVLGTFDIQDTATVTISNAGTDGHVIVDGLELIKK